MIINVTKLICTNAKRVIFQRLETSRPMVPGDRNVLTTSASPNLYYVPLAAETYPVILGVKEETD